MKKSKTKAPSKSSKDAFFMCRTMPIFFYLICLVNFAVRDLHVINFYHNLSLKEELGGDSTFLKTSFGYIPDSWLQFLVAESLPMIILLTFAASVGISLGWLQRKILLINQDKLGRMFARDKLEIERAPMNKFFVQICYPAFLVVAAIIVYEYWLIDSFEIIVSELSMLTGAFYLWTIYRPLIIVSKSTNRHMEEYQSNSASESLSI